MRWDVGGSSTFNPFDFASILEISLDVTFFCLFV